MTLSDACTSPSAGSAVSDTMQDDQLVALARDGHEAAFSLLLRRYMPVIRRQIAVLRVPIGEAEDLVQEGMMGLFFAVRSYEKGLSSFRTYASVCVRNRLVSIVKRWGAARVIPSSELISMDDEQGLDEKLHADGGDPAHLIVQQEEDSRLHTRLRELLSGVEYDALMLYIQAYSYKEIARQLNIGAKAVDNALQRARRKLSFAQIGLDVSSGG